MVLEEQAASMAKAKRTRRRNGVGSLQWPARRRLVSRSETDAKKEWCWKGEVRVRCGVLEWCWKIEHPSARACARPQSRCRKGMVLEAKILVP